MIDVESDTYMHPSTFKIIGRRIKEWVGIPSDTLGIWRCFIAKSKKKEEKKSGLPEQK